MTGFFCSVGLHSWDGCKCRRASCGQIRDREHDWDGCRCTRCGKIRDDGHVWEGCRCRRCGRTQHVFEHGSCKKCSELLPLRDCPASELRSIAIQRLRGGDQAAVEDLLFIVRGGDRRDEDRWSYTAEVQLIAIEALGESRSKAALEFLQRFGKWSFDEQLTDHCLGGYAGTGQCNIRFRHAWGELRRALEDVATLPSEVKNAIEQSGLAEFQRTHYLSEHYFRNQAYLILAAAIEKLTATVDSGPYSYLHFQPHAWPGAYADGYRVAQFEDGPVSHAILHPSQPYDDDAMLLRWDSERGVWTMSFQLGLLTCNGFPGGVPLQNQTDPGERASLVLLAHFGKEAKAGTIPPAALAYCSPSDIRAL